MFGLAPMASMSERHATSNDGKIALCDEISLSIADFDGILCVSPTGWANRGGPEGRRRDLGPVSFVSVPYSEHSSFTELLAFVQFMQPRAIIPTVSLATYKKFEARFAAVAPALQRQHGQAPITDFAVPAGTVSSADLSRRVSSSVVGAALSKAGELGQRRMPTDKRARSPASNGRIPHTDVVDLDDDGEDDDVEIVDEVL